MHTRSESSAGCSGVSRALVGTRLRSFLVQRSCTRWAKCMWFLPHGGVGADNWGGDHCLSKVSISQGVASVSTGKRGLPEDLWVLHATI